MTGSCSKTGRKKPIGIFLCLLLLILLLSGCKADISAYENEEILITGLTETDFTVTPGELAALPCETAKAVGKSEKAGTVKAYGPTLETFLAQYGVELTDLYAVRFTAKDEYSVRLGKNTWEQYTVYLSVANASKPLYEKQEPLRVVIPGADSGNWIYGVTQIEFTYKSAE